MESGALGTRATVGVNVQQRASSHEWGACRAWHRYSVVQREVLATAARPHGWAYLAASATSAPGRRYTETYAEPTAPATACAVDELRRHRWSPAR